MTHYTQVNNDSDAGWYRRVDKEEEGMRDLKATLVNKDKKKLERSYEGGGWITVLARSHDGTYISWEELRDELRCYIDLPLQNPPPLPCDGCIKPFTVELA